MLNACVSSGHAECKCMLRFLRCAEAIHRRVLWEVELNDVGDVEVVEAARGDVGGDEHSCLALAEALEVVGAHVGRHRAVVVGRRVAVLNQRVVNEARRVLRVAEENYAAERRAAGPDAHSRGAARCLSQEYVQRQDQSSGSDDAAPTRYPARLDGATSEVRVSRV
eukprot:6183946-Pleurochrysis_carterae.AAC.4